MGNETVRGLLRQYADYLTPEETAEVLGISVGTVYRKLQTGDLAGFQLGRQWRVEIISDPYLPSSSAGAVRRPASLERHQSRARLPGLGDDDLLARRRALDEM